MTSAQLQRINELSKSIRARKEEEENEILNEYFQIYINYKDVPFDEIKYLLFTQVKKIPLLVKIVNILIFFSIFIDLPIYTSWFLVFSILLVFLCYKENASFSQDGIFGVGFRFRLSKTINFKNFKFCEPNCSIYYSDFRNFVLSNKFPTPFKIEKEIVRKLNKIEQKLLKEADFDDVIEIYKKEEEI